MRSDPALSALDLAGPWSVASTHAPHLLRLLQGQTAQPPAPAQAAPVTDYTPNPLKPGKRIAVLNVAGMGMFSSDRTIGEYISSVWAQPGA